MGRVTLSLSTPLVFDPYVTNPSTGGFIIIDRLTNNTVGAGMIVGRAQKGAAARGRVTQEEKEVRLGQRGAVVWAKQAIADAVERGLFEEARTVVRLDAGEFSDWPSLASMLRAAAEQAIIVIIASDSAPDPALREALGKRLILSDSPDAHVAAESPARIRRRGCGRGGGRRRDSRHSTVAAFPSLSRVS